MPNARDIVSQARKATKDKRNKERKEKERPASTPEEEDNDEDDTFSIEIRITVKKNGQKLSKKKVNEAISDWCGNILSTKSA